MWSEIGWFCFGDSDVQIREVEDSSTDGRQACHRIGNRGHRQESDSDRQGLFPPSQIT